LPVFPAQIYAAINAAILALLLWVAYPFRLRDGSIMALLLTLYMQPDRNLESQGRDTTQQ
jgi:hypothetical protein